MSSIGAHDFEQNVVIKDVHCFQIFEEKKL